jgi:hypothetical protein
MSQGAGYFLRIFENEPLRGVSSILVFADCACPIDTMYALIAMEEACLNRAEGTRLFLFLKAACRVGRSRIFGCSLSFESRK